MINTLLIALIFFFCAVTEATAAAHKTAADVQRSADFDFLVGVWDLMITSSLPGMPPSMKGRWTATAAADGLMISDEYRVFDDRGATAYLGMTYRAFNPASKQWNIRYVEPMSGKWFDAQGWRDESTMRVQQKGTAQSPTDMLRFQYYDIAADHFRWRSEKSADGGKTWKPYGLAIDAMRSSTERRLAAAKAKIMSADYRADLVELARQRDELLPLKDDPALGYLARYWAGFASWRIAINGASNKMSQENLEANLVKAVADFDASAGLKKDFADSYAAASSVNGWLAMFHRSDNAAMMQYIGRSRDLLTRAKELQPDNPRVLWVVGGVYLFSPAQYGGSTERAIETYRRMLDVVPAADPSSPLPDWGKPEALMSLAFAHLNQKPPDLESAVQEARAALELQPEWSYVRDVLMPQIKTASAH